MFQRKRELSHYFDSGTKYFFRNASSGYEYRFLYPLNFLAPRHIMDYRDTSLVKRVYGSFEDIAEFYRATGKNDTTIDDANKTVTFWCRGNPDSGKGQGALIMQYIETESGNYLEVKPLPEADSD